MVSGNGWDQALDAADRGEQVILVRWETNPDDIHGLIKAQGVMASGGLVPMTTDDGHSTPVVLLPLLMGGRRPGVRSALPKVGEHTDAVLAWLAQA